MSNNRRPGERAERGPLAWQRLYASVRDKIADGLKTHYEVPRRLPPRLDTLLRQLDGADEKRDDTPP